MCTHLRADLLRLVCANLPDDDVTFLRCLPPQEFITHLEAYLAVRRTGTTLPSDLLRQFTDTLLACMDAEHGPETLSDLIGA